MLPAATTTTSCNLRIVRSVQEETPPPDTPSCNLIPEDEHTPQPTFVEVAVERREVEVVESDHTEGAKKLLGTPSTPDASPDQDGSSWIEEFPAVCVCVRACVRACVCVYVSTYVVMCVRVCVCMCVQR